MLNYLRKLAQEDRFPASVTGEDAIDMLRVLQAAGMVQADMPDDGPSGCVGRVARLISITGLGRATLRAETAREFIARRKRLPCKLLLPSKS